MPENNVELSETFKLKIADAIGILAPMFRISPEELASFEEPSCKVVGPDEKILLKDNGAGYSVTTNTIYTRASEIDNPYSIGEETSHYLHHQLNPFEFDNPFAPSEDRKVKSSVGLYWRRRNVEETVGRYGALVYAQIKGAEREHVLDFMAGWEPYINSAFKSGEWKRSLAIRRTTYSYMAHVSGYWRANMVFDTYDDSLLPSLARLSLDEALSIFPRLAPFSFYERRILPWIDKMLGCDLVIDRQQEGEMYKLQLTGYRVPFLESLLD
jgi:hypothetical protein